MNTTAVILTAIGTAAAAATADVTTTGPFVGDANERFENIAPPGQVNGPVEIFGGAGTINDPFANFIMMATNLTSFLTNESIFPYNGNIMGGSVTGIVDLIFDQGATSFGGYFGTVDILDGGSISFYDANDTLIDSQSFDLPLNEWGWQGWSSTEAFTRVRIQGAPNPGLPIVFDDLQVTLVPAPSAGLALLLGGAAMARRRRS